MTENKAETPAVPPSQPEHTQESVAGSGFVRKGADVMFIPPSAPIDEPTPMPMNLAPSAPVAQVDASPPQPTE